MGKLKQQDNFLLSRKIRKECATEFMTLADYVILRNNIREKRQNGTLCNSHLREYDENKVRGCFSIHKHVRRYTALSSGNAGMTLSPLRLNFSLFMGGDGYRKLSIVSPGPGALQMPGLIQLRKGFKEGL